MNFGKRRFDFRRTTLWEGHWVGPYEFIETTFVVFAGFYALFGVAPQSIATVIPAPLYRGIWAGLMAVGALLTIMGLIWAGKRLTAFGLEQVGQLLVGTTSWMYVIALLTTVNHGNAAVAGSYVGGIGAAAFARAVILLFLKRNLLSITRELNGGL
jgi:hypothetical protein